MIFRILLQSLGLVLLSRIWTYQRQVKNMFLKPALPAAYFAGGDVNSTCEVVQDEYADLKFCEDAVLWKRDTGNTLLVSCDSNRLNWNTLMGPLKNPDPRGSIWAYHYTTSDARRLAPVELTGYPDEVDFHPLGIDILAATQKEPAYLLVINHGRNTSTIEQFRLHSRSNDQNSIQAEYVRTYSHPNIVSPNSILPVSPTSFFVTNDHYWTRRLPSVLGKTLPIMETLLVLPLSWVDLVEVDPHTEAIKITTVAKGLAFTNGIAASPLIHSTPAGDIKEIAIANSNRMEVLFYDWDVALNTLAFKERIQVPFAPDNLSYDDETGDLIAAGHPHFLSLIKFVSRKGDAISPSWLAEVSRRGSLGRAAHNDTDATLPAYQNKRALPSDTHQITTLYQSDGSHFGTMSTGVRDGKNLFGTGLYAPGILHCKLG